MTGEYDERIVELLEHIASKLTEVVNKLDEVSGADWSAQIDSKVSRIEDLLEEHFGSR